MASWYDYRYSQKLSAEDPPFYGLLFALIRKADTINCARIQRMWPEEWAEFWRRYEASGGIDVTQGEK